MLHKSWCTAHKKNQSESRILRTHMRCKSFALDHFLENYTCRHSFQEINLKKRDEKQNCRRNNFLVVCSIVRMLVQSLIDWNFFILFFVGAWLVSVRHSSSTQVYWEMVSIRIKTEPKISIKIVSIVFTFSRIRERSRMRLELYDRGIHSHFVECLWHRF